MKKLILCLSVAMTTVLVSCGGGGPEADAEKMCDITKKMKEAATSGKMDDVKKYSEELTKLGEELQDKYKTDADAQKKIADKMMECAK